MFKRTGLDRSSKNRSGVPDPKRFERTGDKSFVVHGDGNNYFEGEVKDPKVKLKSSGRIVFDRVGICLKKCLNRDMRCNVCYRFSELMEEPICQL